MNATRSHFRIETLPARCDRVLLCVAAGAACRQREVNSIVLRTRSPRPDFPSFFSLSFLSNGLLAYVDAGWRGVRASMGDDGEKGRWEEEAQTRGRSGRRS
jgi:hypothetical protein